MKPTRSGAWGSVAVSLLLALSLTACGVSAGDGPQPIDSDIAELLRPEETPTAPETAQQRLLTVTWVRGDKLVRAVRLGVAETRQERLDAALDALLSGPRPVEQTRGFTTLLPPDVLVVGEVKRGRVVVALGDRGRPRAGRAAARRRPGGSHRACRSASAVSGVHHRWDADCGAGAGHPWTW